MFKISESKRSFEENQQDVFYLADTCWSAFTNIRDKDWEYYLDYRKSQGFNILQVNMLQQWDASQSELNLKPFALKENGTFNFRIYNEAYFERAKKMFEMASAKGIRIALVLLWANYIPNTWASQMPIKQLGVFPKDMVISYVDKVMSLYDAYQPIYIISGDTDFQTEEVIQDYYKAALDRVKENNPSALTTLHIRGREEDLPRELRESSNLDFYMFQSGHNSEFQNMSYKLAENFYQKDPQKPILNSEPCYEMMGYSHRIYGRFSREDVRKAAWQSILSGASAGVTYGAHGIWSWHDCRLGFDSSVGEAFESPYDWRDALRFEGAWDYAFIKEFIETYGFFDLIPAQKLLKNNTQEIRVARNTNYILVYVPFNIRIELEGNFVSKKMIYIDLESKKIMQVGGEYQEQGNITSVSMHSFTRDALLIIEE